MTNIESHVESGGIRMLYCIYEIVNCCLTGVFEQKYLSKERLVKAGYANFCSARLQHVTFKGLDPEDKCNVYEREEEWKVLAGSSRYVSWKRSLSASRSKLASLSGRDRLDVMLNE